MSLAATVQCLHSNIIIMFQLVLRTYIVVVQHKVGFSSLASHDRYGPAQSVFAIVEGYGSL